MIILDLELTNIRSYGPEGDRIAFSPGMNFISGANGSGKSTLMSALGYALFGYTPFQRNDHKTFWLRWGAKSGLIKARIRADDERIYRMERRLGSRQSWIVYDQADDLALTNSVAETEMFLADLFGLEEPGGLGRLFSQVVGVGQGMFTAFFSIPSLAPRKKQFDELLGVSIYERLWQKIGPVENQILRTKAEDVRLQQADLKGVVRDRAEVPELLAAAQAELDQVREGLAELTARYKSLAGELNQAREIARNLVTAEKKQAALTGDLGAVRERLTARKKAVEECLKAEETAARLKPIAEQRRKADLALRELAQKRKQRDELTAGLNRLVNRRTEAEASLRGNIDQRKTAAEELEQQAVEAAGLDQRLDQARKDLNLAEAARREAEEKLKALQSLAKGRKTDHDIDPDLAEKALAVVRLAREKDHNRDRRTDLLGRIKNLDEYLGLIGDGLCPIIEETCPRIKPDNLEARRADLRAGLAEVDKQSADLASKSAEAEQALNRILDDSDKNLAVAVRRESRIEAEVKSLVQRRKEATRRRAGLTERLEKLDRAGRRLEEKIKELAGQIEEATRQLTPFADLADQEAEHARTVEQTEADYRQYQICRSTAHQLDQNKIELTAAEKEIGLIEAKLEAARAEAAELANRHDPEKITTLETEQADLSRRSGAAKADEGRLAKETARLNREKDRLDQAKKELARLAEDLARIQRASDLTTAVRRVYRQLGPRMARRMRRQITGRANRIYADLAAEPGRLIWDRDYEVHVESAAGKRNFRQLSGGEQMIAALSFQLALSADLAGLGFCIFDEPSVNLDEEHRIRLAQSLSRVGREFNFNQLFIISHDHTFSPGVEHHIRLVKHDQATEVEAG